METIITNKKISIISKDFAKFATSLHTFTTKHKIALVINAKSVDEVNFNAILSSIVANDNEPLDVEVIKIGSHIHIFALPLVTFTSVQIPKYLTVTETETNKTNIVNPIISITTTFEAYGKVYTEAVLLVQNKVETESSSTVATIDFSRQTITSFNF